MEINVILRWKYRTKYPLLPMVVQAQTRKMPSGLRSTIYETSRLVVKLRELPLSPKSTNCKKKFARR